MQLTRISNSEVTLDVAALGAEMQTLTTRDGRHWLWSGDANFWTGRYSGTKSGYARQGFETIGGRDGSGFEMNAKRYPKGKDPLSVTAALATIQDYHNDLLNKRQQHADETPATGLGYGEDNASHTPRKMVIHASREVRVQDSERTSHEKQAAERHQLEPTSTSKAWIVKQ